MANATRGGCTAAADRLAAFAGPAALAETTEFAASAEFAPATSSALAFGLGIEGSSRTARESFIALGTETAQTFATASAKTFATDFTKSTFCGRAPSRTMVANSIGSPQWLREQLGPHSQQGEYTAQKASWHWSIGHILLGTLPWPFGLPLLKPPY